MEVGSKRRWRKCLSVKAWAAGGLPDATTNSGVRADYDGIETRIAIWYPPAETAYYYQSRL
jgi:hypothetical protein